MVFREEEVDHFLRLFNESKTQIRAFPGCEHLELFQATADPTTFFTYSYWESEAALNVYRDSPLFKSVWAQTKVLFAQKPQAWSVAVIAEL